MVKVLFVCMGNICRSPTAEGVMRHLVDQERLTDAAGRPSVTVDSAGTISYHQGDPPDPRAVEAALRRGIELAGQTARRIRAEDFDEFDYLLAMDRNNYADLEAMCPPGAEDKLHLFLSFAPELGLEDVPDPYYGRSDGFEYVLDLIDEAARGLLADIRRRHFG